MHLSLRSSFRSTAGTLVGFMVAITVSACGESPMAATAATAASETSAAVRGTDPRADHRVTVPFRGRGAGQDSSITLEATGIRIVAFASGTATGVGRFTERLDYVLSYDLVNFAGTATITAANGSQLFLEFTGAIPGFDLQVFPLPYTAAYSITGGTGRLAGSTGAGTLRGIDYGGGAFAFFFTGERTFDR